MSGPMTYSELQIKIIEMCTDSDAMVYIRDTDGTMRAVVDISVDPNGDIFVETE